MLLTLITYPHFVTQTYANPFFKLILELGVLEPSPEPAHFLFPFQRQGTFVSLFCRIWPSDLLRNTPRRDSCRLDIERHDPSQLCCSSHEAALPDSQPDIFALFPFSSLPLNSSLLRLQFLYWRPSNRAVRDLSNTIKQIRKLAFEWVCVYQMLAGEVLLPIQKEKKYFPSKTHPISDTVYRTALATMKCQLSSL